MGRPWTDDRRARRREEFAAKRAADPALSEEPADDWPGFALWRKLPMFMRSQWCGKGHARPPDGPRDCRACTRIKMRERRRTLQEVDPRYDTDLVYRVPRRDAPLDPKDPAIRVVEPLHIHQGDPKGRKKRKVAPTTWRLVSWKDT